MHRRLFHHLFWTTCTFLLLSFTTTEAEIPISTPSSIARDHFLHGRDLQEKIRPQEAVTFFEAALDADPDFALGHLYLALSSQAGGFFQHLNEAITRLHLVSEGEQLLIKSFEAAFTGNPSKQRDYLIELTQLHPDDPRAHNLLGNNYFGQQVYDKAIESYLKAIQLDSSFSQPYNQLGYCYRFLGDFQKARTAFKKYIELIPDDPNPYDSYAELLLKMGKFESSISAYKQALEVNPNFLPSYLGIATNLNLMGRHIEARKQLSEFYHKSQSDAQRRAVNFAMVVSYVDENKLGKALEQMKDQYAIAQKNQNIPAIAQDLTTMGHILLEMGNTDAAHAKYAEALTMIESSTLNEKAKANSRRLNMYNQARVELARGDINAARELTNQFYQAVKAINNPTQIRQAHELAGIIDLAAKQFDQALASFQRSNLRNPYNLYRIALAFEGSGKHDKARNTFDKAANFNVVNNLNYAFVRSRAVDTLASM